MKKTEQKGPTKHPYQKLQKDVSEEIGHHVKVLKTEIEWLEQHSEAKIRACTTQRDLLNLVYLRNHLEETARKMRMQNYFHTEEEGEITCLLYGDVEDDYLDPDSMD